MSIVIWKSKIIGVAFKKILEFYNNIMEVNKFKLVYLK